MSLAAELMARRACIAEYPASAIRHQRSENMGSTRKMKNWRTSISAS
jgi:hypothetical protein